MSFLFLFNAALAVFAGARLVPGLMSGSISSAITQRV